MERANFDAAPAAVMDQETKTPKWLTVGAVGFTALTAALTANQTAQFARAEEAPAPTPTEATTTPEPEPEATPAPVTRPAPKPWKYWYAKPSHGPLPKRLQRELNSITPSMYRKMKRIGDQCEGRRGKWRRDNGAYGGGLNIWDGNWPAYGGKQFARKTERATPAEQMVVMMRIQSDFGWGVPNWCPLAQYGPWKPQYRIFKRPF